MDKKVKAIVASIGAVGVAIASFWGQIAPMFETKAEEPKETKDTSGINISISNDQKQKTTVTQDNDDY